MNKQFLCLPFNNYDQIKGNQRAYFKGFGAFVMKFRRRFQRKSSVVGLWDFQRADVVGLERSGRCVVLEITGVEGAWL